MLRFSYLLLFSMLAFTVNAQTAFTVKDVMSKMYVSKGNKYIEFINDTLINTSINYSFDTASFVIQGDSILLKQKEFGYLNSKASDYQFRRSSARLLSLTNDTVIIEQPYPYPSGKKPASWEDTLVMVNIELLKEPVDSFNYFKYGIESWQAFTSLSIDSYGIITYVKTPIDHNGTIPKLLHTKSKNYVAQLSTIEFLQFKNMLSRFLPSRMPPAVSCAYDGIPFTIDISIGKKIYHTKACGLEKIQSWLLKYIQDKNYEIGKKMN